jgi:hypothetical protein
MKLWGFEIIYKKEEILLIQNMKYPAKNQISFKYRLIERNTNITILQICQKTQISLDPKKYRYVGGITGSKTEKRAFLYGYR